jgi:hypothetical protein
MEISQMYESINKIDGVLSVKIIEENGEISEVHILANKLRAPKQIVRDIESSLIVLYDYKIDRRVISIVQIDTEDTSSINRIQYAGIIVNSTNTSIECTVKLCYEDGEAEVTLSRVRTLLNSRKIVAEATIRTIEEIIQQASIFDIQDVIVTEGRDVSFVSVIVNMITKGQEDAMVGSAIIKNDINEAIVKATLDAINRRVQKSTH